MAAIRQRVSGGRLRGDGRHGVYNILLVRNIDNYSFIIYKLYYIINFSFIFLKKSPKFSMITRKIKIGEFFY